MFCMRVCTYLHMVYVTHTEAPRKEGKQRSVMKMVVIWLTLYGFLGAWQFIITLLCGGEQTQAGVKGHRFHHNGQKKLGAIELLLPNYCFQSHRWTSRHRSLNNCDIKYTIYHAYTFYTLYTTCAVWLRYWHSLQTVCKDGNRSGIKRCPIGWECLKANHYRG